MLTWPEGPDLTELDADLSGEHVTVLHPRDFSASLDRSRSRGDESRDLLPAYAVLPLEIPL